MNQKYKYSVEYRDKYSVKYRYQYSQSAQVCGLSLVHRLVLYQHWFIDTSWYFLIQRFAFLYKIARQTFNYQKTFTILYPVEEKYLKLCILWHSLSTGLMLVKIWRVQILQKLPRCHLYFQQRYTMLSCTTSSHLNIASNITLSQEQAWISQFCL